MLKRASQLFEFLFMITDLVVLSIAWCLSYWIRFNTDLLPKDKGIPYFYDYLTMLVVIWVIWAFVFKRMGLYRPMRAISRGQELWKLLNANALAILLFIAVTYLFREKSVQFSRAVFVCYAVLSTVFLMIERAALRYLLREVRRRGYNLRYLLIVGSGKLAGDIAARIRMHRELGMQVLGCLAKDSGSEKTDKSDKTVFGLSIIGKYSDLPKLLETMDIDKIIIALPLEDNHLLPEIMSNIGDNLVDVKIVPDMYQFVTLGGYIEEFDGLPVISLQSSPLDGINLFIKRLCDLLIASLALLLLSPLLLLIGLIIRLSSKGPVVYEQERVSLDGSSFNIYKFRTMDLDSEASGPGWTVENDKRVTSFGKFLRAFSLDELPQLINVLRGDMSIVGPRPERPVYIQEFKNHVPKYMLRHKVPAGMTGWAQVNGWRGNTSIGKRIEYDLYYIENWSLLLDFKILFLTLFRGFRNKNAY